MDYNLYDGAKRVVADLRELAQLTSDENGAQRVAWTPIWQKARDWFAAKAREAGAELTVDAAGNVWAKIAGTGAGTVALGSHLDCVPNGGWLDGCFGVVAALEVLRRYGKGAPPQKTVYVVDWADEEGARFGRSLVGSSAASGALDTADIADRVDNNGVKLTEALAGYNVNMANILRAHEQFKEKKIDAYLELHIEQGPVLESMKKAVACVYGITGVERHYVIFKGQAAHAGSFPTLMRQDAFLAAAQAALAFREVALKFDGVCTVGKVSVKPDVVTIVPETCVISLDQRSIDGKVLKEMNDAARAASAKAAADHGVQVTWEKIWTIAPTIFDPRLTELCKQAVADETGEASTIFSGPLHDAAEMAKLVPTVMMFAMSEAGLSHTKKENTPDDALETAVRAFLRLADKVIN
ncbi:MAG: hydantoinase/carbamoylase family amidase [Negativicutes bacterium]|nr:hydantoinase/carbamoylase family amidase [Negativicutes bacterium]